MNPNQMQGKTGDNQMTPNQAMGNLGFINTMQEQLLQHKAAKAGVQPKQVPQTPQNAPQPQETKESTKDKEPDENEAKMTKLELDMTKKIDDLRKELGDKHKLEIESLRNDIKSALDMEENNEPS